MLTVTAKSPTHVQLRRTAEVRLQAGSAPATQGWVASAAALTMLHGLASNPATAADALKLLHELQVHQVELDLQHEHMEEDRRELEASVHGYAELYDHAPVAYFTVDSTGRIINGNLAAARMLGMERNHLGGQGIDILVPPGSRLAVLALVAKAHGSGQCHSCRVQAAGAAGAGWLQMAVSAAPKGQSCLVVVTDLIDSNAPGMQA